jgi:ribosomal protein S18 acetylase RimI-like enzyme
MTCDLAKNLGAPHLGPEPAKDEMWEQLPPHLVLEPWRPQFYDAAAELIQHAYAGHMDSNINDQYRTVHGAQRFLHNIIRFPGCGIFDGEDSWVLRDARTNALEGIILCSRVRPDVAHITQLCVRKDLRRLGLGEALLHHCAAKISHRGVTMLSLTVTEANTAALQLYERNGFTTLHRFEAMIWDKKL